MHEVKVFVDDDWDEIYLPWDVSDPPLPLYAMCSLCEGIGPPRRNEEEALDAFLDEYPECTPVPRHERVNQHEPEWHKEHMWTEGVR